VVSNLGDGLGGGALSISVYVYNNGLAMTCWIDEMNVATHNVYEFSGVTSAVGYATIPIAATAEPNGEYAYSARCSIPKSNANGNALLFAIIL
jgi:hypothetical protein